MAGLTQTVTAASSPTGPAGAGGKQAQSNRQQHPRVARRKLFPEKLWDLVNKPASGIHWSPDGKKIHVDRPQLEKFIGTKFRSHNFDSFIRQLHFYGFRKCGDSYHHDKFQRDQPDALLTMKRKYSSLNFQQTNSSSSSQQAHFTNNASNSAHSSQSDIDQSPKKSTAINTRAKPATCHPTLTSFLHLPSVNNKPNSRPTTSFSAPKPHQEPLFPSLYLRNKPERAVKEITMYTLSDTSDSPFTNAFTNVHQGFLAKAYSENTSICISLPETLDNDNKVTWPKTLVLENCWNGMENVLSAHFIYPTN